MLFSQFFFFKLSHLIHLQMETNQQMIKYAITDSDINKQTFPFDAYVLGIIS